MNTEKTPLQSDDFKKEKAERKRMKVKIFFYFMTIICAIGFIVSGVYGLTHVPEWKPSVDVVTFLYACIAGLFTVGALLPMPHWKQAMEIWFPFMFSLLGRAAYFLIVGPLLVGAGPVGEAFGCLSIINGFTYLIAYFTLRKDNFKKSFLRPFEKDKPDKEDYNWLEFAPSLGLNENQSKERNSEPTNQSKESNSQPTEPYNPFEAGKKTPSIQPNIPSTDTVNPFPEKKEATPSKTRSLANSNSSSVSSSPSPPLSRNSSVKSEPEKSQVSRQATNPFDSSTTNNNSSSTKPATNNPFA